MIPILAGAALTAVLLFVGHRVLFTELGERARFLSAFGALIASLAGLAGIVLVVLALGGLVAELVGHGAGCRDGVSWSFWWGCMPH
jgi:hypothetical protein